MGTEHITRQNPHGHVTICQDKSFHLPHEWLSYGGNYTLDYCPGRRASKKVEESLQRLIDTALHAAEGEGVFLAAKDGGRVMKVERASYSDGSPALFLDGEVVSINLSAYGLIPPDGQIYVPGYSEHSGLPAKLIDLGVATPVREVTFGPFDAYAWLMRIL